LPTTKIFGPIHEILCHPSIHLDLGCGYGEFIFSQAEENPTTLHIAVEMCPWLFPVLKKRAKKMSLKNLIVVGGEIEDFWSFFKPSSIDILTLLFPDPWWKKKHHKNRHFDYDFLWYLQSKLKKGGRVIIASDVWFLQLSMMSFMDGSPFFENEESFFNFSQWPFNFKTKRAIKTEETGLNWHCASYKRNEKFWNQSYRPYTYVAPYIKAL